MRLILFRTACSCTYFCDSSLHLCPMTPQSKSDSLHHLVATPQSDCGRAVCLVPPHSISTRAVVNQPLLVMFFCVHRFKPGVGQGTMQCTCCTRRYVPLWNTLRNLILSPKMKTASTTTCILAAIISFVAGAPTAAYTHERAVVIGLSRP